MIYIGHVPRRKSVAIGITENGRTRIVGYLRNEDDAEDLILALEHALHLARETAVKAAWREHEIETGASGLARGLARARRLRTAFPHAHARAD